MLDKNLQALRRARGLTQEQTAAAVGVTRQALSKWESGESLPDLRNCAALARFYDVTVDDLLNYDPGAAGLPLPPRGKHSFGFVTVDEAGRLPLPEAARQLFAIGPGDRLLLLGEEGSGLAMLREQDFEAMLRGMRGG